MRPRPLGTGCLFFFVAFFIAVGLGTLIVYVAVPAVKGERPADATPTPLVIVEPTRPVVLPPPLTATPVPERILNTPVPPVIIVDPTATPTPTVEPTRPPTRTVVIQNG